LLSLHNFAERTSYPLLVDARLAKISAPHRLGIAHYNSMAIVSIFLFGSFVHLEAFTPNRQKKKASFQYPFTILYFFILLLMFQNLFVSVHCYLPDRLYIIFLLLIDWMACSPTFISVSFIHHFLSLALLLYLSD
jgi:hypothetical protein